MVTYIDWLIDARTGGGYVLLYSSMFLQLLNSTTIPSRMIPHFFLRNNHSRYILSFLYIFFQTLPALASLSDISTATLNWNRETMVKSPCLVPPKLIPSLIDLNLSTIYAHFLMGQTDWTILTTFDQYTSAHLKAWLQKHK